MGGLLGLVGGFLVKLLGSGIVAPVLTYLKSKNDTARDLGLAQTGADRDRDLAVVQANVDANHLKAAAQPQFRLLIYVITLPMAAQMGALYLDSFPWWTPWGAHVVGSWGVPKPPPPYDDYQKQIILSFFVLAPVSQGISLLGTALSTLVRKR